MSFAEDKVKKYIDKNLRRFQNRVRVAQMLHLSCLTDADREEITSYERNYGNSRAVWHFLQLLHIRVGWVQQFIDALWEDNIGDLAQEIQDVYERHLLPSPRRNVPAPAASCATPKASALPGPRALSCNPSPPAEPALPPGQSPPLARDARPPVPADAPRPAPSAVSPEVPHDMSEASPPIQETELPSKSSEMTVRPKVAHGAEKPESSTPPNKSTASPSEVGGPKPVDAQATSAANASPSLPGHLEEEEALPSPPPVSLRPGAGSLTRRWDSGQQRSMPERNRFSGNVNAVKDHSVSPTRTGALGLKTSENQPEENYYSSADNSPLAPGCREERQERRSLQEGKVQALRVYRHEERSDSPVGTDASPMQLQRQFDAEQERALGSQASGGNVAVVDVGGGMPEVDPARATPGDLETRDRGDCVPANATDGLLVNPVGNGHASQIPGAAVFRPPSSNWEGFSSTIVIPPDSPTGCSAAPSDFDSGVIKLPVQEKKPPFREPAGTHTSLLMQEKVPGSSPSTTVDRSTMNLTSRNDRIFHSNCDDDSLHKPGVLTSLLDEPPVRWPGQQLCGQEAVPEYSGRTDRFHYSGRLTLGSDSLQLSDSSRSGPSGDFQLSDSSRSGPSGERCPKPEGSGVSGRNVRSRTPDAPRQPSNGGHQDNGSIRTFVHSVKEDASVELMEAADGTGVVGDPGSRSPDVLPNSATGRQPVKGIDSHCGDSQPNEEAKCGKPSSSPSSYMLLIAGAALASVAVLVFVLLKRK
ncbi:mitochondrial antiviral-signaling protein [Pogona vitticeps]